MFPEISLHIMDIVQNSIKAEAKLIQVDVNEQPAQQLLTVVIADDGKGMDEETVKAVLDPFYTSRTTRKVGLGIPFYQQAAEMTGGKLEMESRVGIGTRVTAVFHTDNIDCMPLGNMNDTIGLLINMNTHLDLVYTRRIGANEFVLDTREMREILGDDVPLNAPDVRAFIQGYLEDNENELKNGL